LVERRPPKPEVEGSSPSSPALIMNKIINYFKGISLEMKKVSWLTKEQLLNSTFIVLGFAVLISIFLFVLDFSLVEFVKIVFGIDI
tara:strand:+ start:231 stop:488 length:258 start_codon:yes stop_codon:yes gene_type:complete